MEAVSIDDPPDKARQTLSDLAYSPGCTAMYEWYGEGEWSSAVAFSPDGRYIASASNLGGLVLWDLENGQEIWRIKAYQLEPVDDLLLGANYGIRTVGFTPDGKTIITGSVERADQYEEVTQFWDAATGEKI